MAQKIFQVFNHLIFMMVCLTCILPFLNLLAVSFSDSAAVRAGWVKFFPINFTTASYEFAFRGGRFLPSLWVSVQRVALGVFTNLFLMILAAYPLSHPKEKLMGRNIYMIFFITTMVLNGGIIPTYLLVSQIGLLNSIWALVLPSGLPVFSMIILMNFIRSLPPEIEESANIDGANPIKFLLFIMLPLLTPSLATVGLFSIVYHWNDWFGGMIYIQNYLKYPLQTYLQMLLRKFEDLIRMNQTNYADLIAQMNVRNGRAAQLFLGSIPIALIYPFLQKYFTTGLVMGSVKG